MKILFLTRLYYPHVGGVEKHIAKLSKVLISNGHQITVLTTKFESRLSVNEVKDGINIIRFNQPKLRYIGLLFTWVNILKNRKIIKESDLIHIHDVFVWYWPLKLIYPHKKVFVTNHGQWGDYPITFSDILNKKISRKLSDGVISIGGYIDKNYGIKSELISYGAVDIRRKSKNKIRNLFLYVGRLDKNTGLGTFLSFLKMHKLEVKGFGLSVVFCGDGELREECSKYGKVLGWTNPSLYYKKAKFVFASGYLTILESFANKCVTFVSYKNPLQKDYYLFTPFKKLICVLDNPNAIFQKLKYYLQNENAVQKITEKGYNWAIHQTWEKMARTYEKLWFK